MPETAHRHRLPPGPAERFTLNADAASLAFLQRAVAAHGDMLCIWSNDRQNPSLFLNEPEAIRRVLVSNHSNYVKGVGFERVKMLLGNGIIVSDGETWRRQRTMMQPAFSRSSVTRLSAFIRAHNLELRDTWSAHAGASEVIDVTEAMSHYALEVILRAIFSTDLPQLLTATGTNPFAFLAEDPTRDIRTVLRVRELGRVIMDCIHARRRSGERPFDFLSMLLDARDKRTGTGMSDAELLDEVKTLIVAGHETSAGTLNWAWYLLSQHPEVEQRVLDELATTGADVDFGFDRVMSLEYLPRVLRETLRLYPPVWLFSRRALEADRLGDWDVPAGAHIFISPYLLHRNPSFWPDPERFDPERFSEPAVAERDREAFIPFSSGARRCIGEYFSFVEMQTHLAVMAPRFCLSYEGAAPVPIEPAVNLRSQHGIRMRITPRPRREAAP